MFTWLGPSILWRYRTRWRIREYLHFSGPIAGFSDDDAQLLAAIRNNDWAQYELLDFR